MVVGSDNTSRDRWTGNKRILVSSTSVKPQTPIITPTRETPVMSLRALPSAMPGASIPNIEARSTTTKKLTHAEGKNSTSHNYAYIVSIYWLY